jgi:hypothetical protein
MLRAMLILMLSMVVAVYGETLEQKLAKRELTLALRPGQSLAEALAALSADYRAKYREPLNIFVSVDLAHPAPPQKGRVVPPPNLELDSGRTNSGPLRAPVIELLRYCGNLTNARITIQGDFVLFHSPEKHAR